MAARSKLPVGSSAGAVSSVNGLAPSTYEGMLALACNALGDDARGDELLIQFRAMLALAPGVGILQGRWLIRLQFAWTTTRAEVMCCSIVMRSWVAVAAPDHAR
jgi:hypothetical protein